MISPIFNCDRERFKQNEETTLISDPNISTQENTEQINEEIDQGIDDVTNKIYI